MIVNLEGIDGSGKGTQAARFIARLMAQGYGADLVRLLKFPDYSTPTGKLIEEWLHGRIAMCLRSTVKQDALAFQCALTANRVEHAETLQHFKHQGCLVVDRYWPSGVAYGGSDGLDMDTLVKFGAGLPQADLHILLDIPVGVALDRQASRGRADRYEGRESVMEACRGIYLDLWASRSEKTPHAWVVVDGTKDEAAVASEIWAAYQRWMLGTLEG